MRYIIKESLIISITFQLIFISSLSTAEIYRWVDDKGRIQFSDSPNPNYNSQALANTSGSPEPVLDVSSLQRTARQLKQDRLKREKAAKKLAKAKRQKRLRNEKIIAKKKKKKQACDNAQKKENLAFRQRTKSRNLTAMRKALERYEKKRMIRIKRCQ